VNEMLECRNLILALSCAIGALVGVIAAFIAVLAIKVRKASFEEYTNRRDAKWTTDRHGNVFDGNIWQSEDD
jgi:hypothetical protein